MNTAHPAWCDRRHDDNYPVHTADVGDADIELGETDLSVGLYQHGDNPTQIWLCEHTHADTKVTILTGEQAEQLGRRLLDAAGMHGQYTMPLGPGLSGPGGGARLAPSPFNER